jgi:hypothetical protein
MSKALQLNNPDLELGDFNGHLINVTSVNASPGSPVRFFFSARKIGISIVKAEEVKTYILIAQSSHLK